MFTRLTMMEPVQVGGAAMHGVYRVCTRTSSGVQEVQQFRGVHPFAPFEVTRHRLHPASRGPVRILPSAARARGLCRGGPGGPVRTGGPAPEAGGRCSG